MTITQEPESFTLFKLKVPETGNYYFTIYGGAYGLLTQSIDYSKSNPRMILMQSKNGSNTKDGIIYVKGGKGNN